MSEYDENKLNNEEKENETSENHEYTDSTHYGQQSAYNSQQPPVNHYTSYQNQQFNQNQSQQRYYYGNNQQPYGRNSSQNYVYYGNSGSYQTNSQNYAYNPTQQNSSYSSQNPIYTQGPEENPKSKAKGKKVFAACIVMIVVVAIILTVFSAHGKIGKKELTTEKVDGPSLTLVDSQGAAFTGTNGDLTAAGVYDKVKESSVGVLVYSSNTSVAAGEGSGVIVGEDKAGKYTYIITCAHVIESSNSVRVQLHDETQCEATVIGSDARTDIAVLRIAKTGLKAFEIGDSEKLVVGETIYAIGNPGGVDFAGSFTNGMISAIARPISSEIGYKMICIQHTAAINPGNSGGALVNAKGQLVGINSSKIASTDYEGMGFSVPSKTFVDVYNEIIEHGYVTNRPKLGITYIPASASQSYSMLVGVKGLPAGSIVIQSINADSSLAGKGVEVGDLITKVNGEELENTDMLPKLIEKSKVGDKLTLTICHFDKNYQMKEFDIDITLVEDKGEVENVAEMTTTPSYYDWNPFGSYFGE